MRRADSSSPGLSELIDWREIVRHWYVVAQVTVAICMLAATYLVLCDPVYEAETRVVIQNVGLEFENRGSGSSYDKEFLSTQAEIIGSPATINRSLAELPPVGSTGDDPVTAISDSLRVSPLANTDIVRVTYQHSDPQHAVERLASLINSYRLRLQEVEQSSSSQSVELLAMRASELEEQIAELQEQLRAARSSAGYSTGTERDTAGSPVMEELLTRWATVQSHLASIGSSLAAEAGPALATSISDINPDWSHELTQLQTDLTLAKVQAEELAGIYGPAHAERLAADQRLTSLQLQFQVREVEVRSNLSAQQTRLEHEVTVLNGLLAEEQSRIASMADARLDEQQLQSDLTRLTELHASTVQTLETLRLADRTIAGGRGSIRIEILDEFVVPTVPVWPRPVPLMAIAAILGVLLGVSVVVVMQYRYGPLTPDDHGAASDTSLSSESHLFATARYTPVDVHGAGGTTGTPPGKLVT